MPGNIYSNGCFSNSGRSANDDDSFITRFLVYCFWFLVGALKNNLSLQYHLAYHFLNLDNQEKRQSIHYSLLTIHYFTIAHSPPRIPPCRLLLLLLQTRRRR